MKPNYNINSGFLIVKTYAAIYQEYALRYQLTTQCYAIPRIDKEHHHSPVKYRGLDRDALEDKKSSRNTAEIKMTELARKKMCSNGFILNLESAERVHHLLDGKKDNYEIIWTKNTESEALPPPGYCSAGFEPTFFYGDHFSAICDCMLLPRWNGTDQSGKLFGDYFQKLNEHGLFNEYDQAVDFLKYYMSFDWTELASYEIAEVFIKNLPV